MNNWRPNAAFHAVFKNYVIEFRNGPIPVLIYLQMPNPGEFDAYVALLRTTDDTPVGQADFIEVKVSAGIPFGRPYWKRVLGIEVGPVLWHREQAWVYRTVFVSEITLSSGKVIPAHRVSKPFGHTRFDIKGKTLEQENAQLLAWANPVIQAAMAVERFREEMIDGGRKVAEAVHRLQRPITRAKYEQVCRQLGIKPLRDNELHGVMGGNPYFSHFPDTSPEESIANTAHLYRQWAIGEEKLSEIK